MNNASPETPAEVSQPLAENFTTSEQRGNRLRPSRFNRLYWHLKCLREELQRAIDKFINSDRSDVLLDYGCGNMPYRLLFSDRVAEYVACDLPGNKEADLLIDEIGRMPVDDCSADVVLSTQVLEHVPDPCGYLNECYRVLGQDGRLILSTHGAWRFHPDPNDYWRWTNQGLRKIVADAGFEIIEFRGVMSPASYAIQFWQDAVMQKMPGFLRPPFFFVMQLMVELADRLSTKQVRRLDSSVFLLVGCKKDNANSPVV